MTFPHRRSLPHINAPFHTSTPYIVPAPSHANQVTVPGPPVRYGTGPVTLQPAIMNQGTARAPLGYSVVAPPRMGMVTPTFTPAASVHTGPPRAALPLPPPRVMPPPSIFSFAGSAASNSHRHSLAAGVSPRPLSHSLSPGAGVLEFRSPVSLQILQTEYSPMKPACPLPLFPAGAYSGKK
eukprot:Cvel_25069.t1-p1 / transcript=Cvel_25069.t1 / gene=Cvel_25069 / organism=Chromera_velia_CCMP2878 / gene_product=hypothetical protein / transcript_product=hypothetical protein / location=Cvel_scaffold2790:580-1119(-) / protein_length=180 / sequence_SO=supercontig / SO=protein_coding / is_pseudo=false